MNILIVESENDEYFIQALVNKISINNKVCSIDDFKHSSLSEESLKTQIANALRDVNRGEGVSKIGIILDIDDSNKAERLELINKCLSKAFEDCGYRLTEELTDIKQFKVIPIDEEQDIQISCYFTNVDGQGELETVLKEIKTQDSTFADCLEDGWKNCLSKKNKIIVGRGEKGDISNKEILKLWVEFYKRFDTLKKGERREESTCWKGIMLGETKKNKKVTARGEAIFNLESPILTDLISFLQMFD